MKKALVLFADGFEEIEALTVVDVLRRGEVDCLMCSTSDTKCVKGAHDVNIQCNILLKQVNPSDYGALIIPGGMPGAENLRDNDEVINLVKRFNSENKILGAICAGPIVFEKAGVLKEISATSYPGFKDKLHAGKYIENKVVVQDKNIITSRGPATAPYFAFKILENLTDKDTADNIKNDMLISFVENVI
ncbi:DJ-1 family glyoxalase III [Clostridium sp. JN-1]|uniref:DJ-1 family glyoxalase III n=1 Tax=Clostridium sp. JN-1 TaxID=2483110 RepID=UPI000F0B5864|nr:DJ-1 family glyoxalase III [Clostridium sp. JN-1]